MLYALVSAILTLLPFTGETRATRIATDIASTDASPEEGLLLVTLARYESDFRQAVESCAVTGDHGQAFGLWQLHAIWGDPVRMCREPRYAARRALSAVRVCRNLRRTDVGTIACFTGRGEDNPGVRARLKAYTLLVGVKPS